MIPGLERTGIQYWIFNYAPQWEAASREVRTLAAEFAEEHGTRVLALNLAGERLRLRGSEKVLPLPYALGALPVLRWTLGRARLNHLFASAAERLITPRLGASSLLTVAKDTASLTKLERNLPHLRSLRYVVTESERDREFLRQGGVAAEALKLIYPGAEPRPYQAPEGPFTILFATSPLGGHGLLSRGVYLLVQAARLLPEVRFLLVWRDRHLEALRALLAREGVRNVEVRNGFIPDMGALYDTVHATVLPGLEAASLKPCPHSALDSLAHGKPVLMSRPTSIAGVIERRRCGVLFEPAAESLRAAVLELRERYAHYQESCHPTVAECFSPTVFRERYRALYATML